MSRFVRLPNLPNEAGLVIIGQRYGALLEKPLARLGIDALLMPDNPCVDARLSGHVDLSAFHAGGEKVCLAPYLKDSSLRHALEDMGADINLLAIQQGRTYPEDARMNVCVIGDALIYAEKVTSENIVEYLTNCGIKRKISSRQGYAKCSVCVVDERAIITADSSIAKAARKEGLEVLLIAPGYVNLPGFDYGFIGGAAFKIAKNKLAFTGRLDRHPNRTEIFDFLSARGIEPVFLTDEPVFDIGSGIPILEKNNQAADFLF